MAPTTTQPDQCKGHAKLAADMAEMNVMMRTLYDAIMGTLTKPGLKDKIEHHDRLLLGSEAEEEVGLVRGQKGNRRAIDDLKESITNLMNLKEGFKKSAVPAIRVVMYTVLGFASSLTAILIFLIKIGVL